MERKLDWKPIEQAPHGKLVLIWCSTGNWHKGRVHHNGNEYEVSSSEDWIIFKATHYAEVEGP